MTKRSSNLREKYLDGERLFRRYYEIGESRSIRMLTEWAIIDGMKSSTGGEPTYMGIWKAMWRWASMKENRDIAWEIVKSNVQQANYGEWKLDMIHVKVPSAWQHNTQIKRDKFLRENGWTDGSKS